jgi:fructose/tagatose bisphosphate aldolase
VLHGGSTMPAEDTRRAVEGGVAKVNIATELNQAFDRALREGLSKAERVWPAGLLQQARAEMSGVARNWIRLLGSAGKAG